MGPLTWLLGAGAEALGDADHAKSSANTLTAKFKKLRHELKSWGRTLSQLKVLIANCNAVIFFMDQLQEERFLSRPEFNFRNIVKVHLKRILLMQSDYWKKWCTMRCVQLGGENTKFFHAKATERYRHNTVAGIKKI